jgi:hypothetical protein
LLFVEFLAVLLVLLGLVLALVGKVAEEIVGLY